MKNIFKILLLLVLPSFCVGQDYSVEFDSLTLSHISKLPKIHQDRFDKILKTRKQKKVIKRLSTLTFDYAFIEETYCFHNSISYTYERYFDKNDSIPSAMYFNGKEKDVKEEYDGFLIWYSKNVTYNYTLTPLIDSYSKLKTIQELPYDKRQIWSHGCVVGENDDKKIEKKRKKELEQTYQIQTMVDNLNSKIIVSVQFAPKNAKFEIYGYNGVWDW